MKKKDFNIVKKRSNRDRIDKKIYTHTWIKEYLEDTFHANTQTSMGQFFEFWLL